MTSTILILGKLITNINKDGHIYIKLLICVLRFI